MGGHSGLTQQVDVYAFAITCVELLTKGKLPWPMADDDAVRYFVLRKAICCQLSLTSPPPVDDNMRPELPLLRVWSQQVSEILYMS